MPTIIPICEIENVLETLKKEKSVIIFLPVDICISNNFLLKIEKNNDKYIISDSGFFINFFSEHFSINLNKEIIKELEDYISNITKEYYINFLRLENFNVIGETKILNNIINAIFNFNILYRFLLKKLLEISRRNLEILYTE